MTHPYDHSDLSRWRDLEALRDRGPLYESLTRYDEPPLQDLGVHEGAFCWLRAFGESSVKSVRSDESSGLL